MITNKLPITAIVLTLNESRNLRACLNSVYSFLDQIIVVDSFSNDNTLEIAGEFTSEVYKHKFVNHSKQFEYALSLDIIRNEWILRLDADERWSEMGFSELRNIIKNAEVNGIYVIMSIYFMHNRLRFGGMSNNLFLRVFKRSKGYIEKRWMDEHIIVDGLSWKSSIVVTESNYDRQENIGLWISKHNAYSTREAVDYLLQKYQYAGERGIANLFGNKLERKRWFKEKFYYNIPLFLRPFLYFLYRYLIKFGILDGFSGLIYNFLHGFWYRLVVDLKIFEIEQKLKLKNMNLTSLLNDEYGFELESRDDE